MGHVVAGVARSQRRGTAYSRKCVFPVIPRSTLVVRGLVCARPLRGLPGVPW